MKILSVIVGSPREDSMWFRVKKQMDILSSLGHEVELCFYTRKRLRFKPPFRYSVIKVSPFNVHLKHFLKVNYGDYDLLFCNLAMRPFICSLSKVQGIPMILDNHGDLVSEMDLLFNLDPLKKLCYKMISFFDFRLSDRIICVSTSMIDDLKQRGVPEDKLYYVTNATDLDFFQPLNENRINKLKEELGLPDKLICGYIGAADKWQGVDSLIKTSKNYRDEDVFFLFVGFSKNKKRDHNSLFLPRVDLDLVKSYYGVSDILVLPRPYHKSTEVAAPTKFAEYAAMGKPILTTDVGDAARLVKKYKCGLVIEDNQPENIIEGINKFKSLSKDDIIKMGQNARKMAEKEFSLKKMKNDMKKVIDSL
ncbi:glycosyltransferase family 4 protein [Methanothermobacter wolfeii]|uniref:glycosyltransferase family 4 protein n=1 Tax=Methanothermobacter wolfeii TaxID=145261 RepID=UPI000A698C78